MSLRFKAAVYFAAGFLLLWSLVSIFLFNSFSKSLYASFDRQLKTRAEIVLERISINPKIIPLPQPDESFAVFYDSGYSTDTIYGSQNTGYIMGMQKKSAEDWRGTTVSKIESTGTITLDYALPATSINKSIDQLWMLLIIILFIGFGMAFLLAYWLGTKIIRPVRQIVASANATNIYNNTGLLQEPEGHDELNELVVSFNRMLLRISEQAANQSAF